MATMLKLTDELVSYLEFKGRKYRLNLWFDNVLRFFELLEDELIDELEKPFIALEMFVYRFDLLRFDGHEEVIELFKFILKNYIGLDVDKAQEGEGEKVYDYTKDAERIYASFLATYKIDLIEEQGKMDWRKFRALLDNLNEDSPFMKAVGYRTVKIPKQTNYNKEEVDRLRKLKRFYSLEEEVTEERANENLNKGFDRLAKLL